MAKMNELNATKLSMAELENVNGGLSCDSYELRMKRNSRKNLKSIFNC